MPRKRQSETSTEASKARVRSFRSRERRQRRSKGNDAPDAADLTWLTNINIKLVASRLLNNHRERPYWLSITHGKLDGNPPISNYFPCTSYRTDTRVYYGFLFREHRDAAFLDMENSRKEFISKD